MMKTSPKIIVTIKVQQYYSSPPSRSKCHSDADYNIKMERYNTSQFYRCNQNYDILKYIERKEAINNQDESTIKNVLDFEQKDTLKDSDFFEYANSRPGSTGVFGPNGSVSNSEIRDKLRNTKSNVWNGVLSFTKDYARVNCSNKSQAEKIMNNTLNTLFVSQGLEPDNVEYFCALHTNTDNPHVHFVYWEKEALKINSKGQRVYSKFMVPKKAINDFKYAVADYNSKLTITPLKNLDFSYRDKIRDAFKPNTIEDNNLQRWLKLDKDLGKRTTKQYARLTSEQRRTLCTFVDEYVNSNPTLKQNWDNYMLTLIKKFNEIKKHHQEAKIPLSKAAKTFYKSRVEELYGRCGNEILKSLQLISESHKNNEEILKDKIKKEKEKLKISYPSKVHTTGKSQNKKMLKDILGALMKEQTDIVNKNINSALKEFYSELEEKGDMAIYEM